MSILFISTDYAGTTVFDVYSNYWNSGMSSNVSFLRRQNGRTGRSKCYQHQPSKDHLRITISGQEEITVHLQSADAVHKRSPKNCRLITMDHDRSIHRRAPCRRIRGVECKKIRSRTDRLDNGRAQHTLKSRNTCFVRWMLFIELFLFTHCARAYTQNQIHTHTHKHTRTL